MGCDIHLFVEHKRGDAWVSWGRESDVCRDYDLFAKMANVRNYNGVEPISKPRGLPSDVSKTVAGISEAWDVDGHSHSWLTLDEVRSLLDHGADIERVVSDMTDCDESRVVFWFDN